MHGKTPKAQGIESLTLRKEREFMDKKGNQHLSTVMREQSVKPRNLIILISIAVVLAFIAERIYSNRGFMVTVKAFDMTQFMSGAFSGMAVRRAVLFFILIGFFGLHFLIPPKTLYAFLFEKRYYVALAVFLFMVLNQYNGYSIANYDNYIQPASSLEYADPVLGEARRIRSDEWVVSTPNRLSASFGDDAFGRYNTLMRATETPNIVAGKMFFCYASLANPLTLGTFLFGRVYGQSILWYGALILTFLVSIEMLLILCKGNKVIASIGAILITFSGYNMWWSQVTWLLGAQACIVCGWHFIRADQWWKKGLLGIGIAIALAYFVTDLYPAWQVPVGYLFFGLMIWMIISNWAAIKAFSKTDWLMLAGALLFALSIIAVYLYYDMEYINSISSTDYPGARFSNGGIDSEFNTLWIQEMFSWCVSPLINNVLRFPNVNQPEIAGFMTLFPLPFITAGWYGYKNKKMDFLTGFLTIYSIALLTYFVVGWPEALAKYTLMRYTLSMRALDVFLFAQLYLLLVSLARLKEDQKMGTGAAVATAITVFVIQTAATMVVFGEWRIRKYLVILAVCSAVVVYALISKKIKIEKKQTGALILMGIFTLVAGLGVNPIQKGLDVIYEKPLSYEIQTIRETDPDGKWLTLNSEKITQQFILANGVPVINSTNIMPNMALWQKLDPENQYKIIYNRYAHVKVKLIDGPTSFKLITADAFELDLNYDDLDTMDVTYIYDDAITPDPELSQRYQLIYDDQCRIYKVK